ncbi:MAG: GGDEF domain-containing protein [Deltaproteobacteria bacterium]|nr:GGDEF domain-containing protein [Deltaproteobacteria bacterium]
MYFDKVAELQNLLAEKEKEVGYYQKLAKEASDERLRETEELSKVSAMLKAKMVIIDQQRRELEKLNQKIQKSCITDDLTGLLNRRGLMMLAHKVFEGFQRHNFYEVNVLEAYRTFVCAILDIDFFKRVNDTYGHLAGDKFLADLSRVFMQPGIFRKIDIIGRYGGEEFMFLLPRCTEKNALIPLGKLQETINSTNFVIDSGKSVRISVSIGVTEMKTGDEDMFKVIDRADEALYYAKKNGRNRIVWFESLAGC